MFDFRLRLHILTTIGKEGGRKRCLEPCVRVPGTVFSRQGTLTLNEVTTMQKRPNAVTFKGAPQSLVGPQLKVGDQAPDFACLTNGLEKVTLASTPGKTRLFSVVPSLDTPVCSMQT